MLTPRRFLFRSLSHYRGIHLSVALGVAVGTAVLSGALLVGDSVRGSLRDLTLDRLGAIDHAMVTDRYFREDLAEDLAEATNFAYAFERAAPAVLIRGSVEAASSGARASRVNIHGIDERFASFYKEPLPLPKSREVVLNESLAREVGAAAGDSVLLRFQTDTLVPSESVMGRKGDNVRTLRLTVAAVVPNRGPGRFGLSPSQQLPFNAYLPLDAVQRALDQNGRANALFVAGSDADAQQLNGILRDVLTLGDLNLSTRNLSTQGLDESFSLGTDRIVLEIPVAEAAQRAGEKANLDAIPILTYLANTLRAGDREIPYSTVTALGPAPAADSLVLAGSSQRGSPAPTLTGDEMLLNEWAARDLKANVGDAIEMTYYVVGAGGALDTATHRFSLRGIVRLRGLAADRHLAPDYKGMSDTERMGDWDPPFPVDLTKIRPIDEDYWERYRSAPKAFVALETAKSLWTSRFGQLTSIRFAPPDIQTQGQSIERTEATFREAFLRELDPAALGLAFQSVKAQGLAASSGATDFSGLFIGFSLFLIVSAAMLVTLLFRLGVERRAKEIGLLLSTGHPVASVRKLLLAEGALISLAGCLVGLPAAVGYGALMVHGLRTWWSAAVGGSFLELHVGTPSLVGGAVGAFLMMVISIWLSLRRLRRFSPRSMLAGALEEERSDAATERASRRPRRLAYGSAATAVLLLALALAKAIPDVAAFFGIGALLLVAAIAAFRATLVGGSRGLVSGHGATPLLRLGARNASRYPTRSVLSVALVAGATFLIVTVAVNRHDVTTQEPDFNSGDGGFRFVAESDLPVYSGQWDVEAEGSNEPKVYPLRAKPGEDASCLNLYRPSRPTLLGATTELIERGGFAFGSTLAESPEEGANPWLILNRDLPGDAIPVFGDANSVQWILHLGLGQELDWTDGRGRARKLVIAGLMPRSLFQSQLVMSEKHFLELFPDRGGYNFFLIESAQPGAGTQLEEQLADQGFDATRTADRLAGYLVVENTYLNTFQTLGGLGLLLGTFGLAVVMIRSVLERRGELALLQAVGFNRSSISGLVLAENGFLLLFGIAIGTVTALLAVLPHLLSGMAQPPWATLSVTLLLILGVGLVAGAAAVTASLRSPLTPALRGQ